MSDQAVIHIVDDEESMRRSLSFLLRSSGHMVQSWAAGPEFLKGVKRSGPGCALLDIRMPEMSGLEVQAELAAQGIDMPVIILTAHGDVSLAVQAMKAGAVDFLAKPFDQKTLLEAVNAAVGRIKNVRARQERMEIANARLGALTARERDVLAGLACGYPNKTIAFDLGISRRTVEVHRANLMLKLGVNSLADALRIAFAAGLGGCDLTRQPDD